MKINMHGPKLHDFNSTPAIEHWLSSGKAVKHLKGHVCCGPRTLKKQNEQTSLFQNLIISELTNKKAQECFDKRSLYPVTNNMDNSYDISD